MLAKKQLGQFFTTNSDAILRGLEPFIAGKNIVDPFAGGGDLLRWARKHGARAVSGYDIDPALADGDIIRQRDSFAEPLRAECIVTNPPYLYQNKLKDNSLLAASKHTDLYQLALEKLMDSKEGIIIVPINFLSAENAQYIRRIFLEKFALIKANYFTEAVFTDTTYNIVAFYYRQKPQPAETMTVNFTVYPENRQRQFRLYRRYNWQIGGEFLAEIKACGNKMRIERLEEEDVSPGTCPVRLAYNHLETKRESKICASAYQTIKNNIIILKAIDTGSAEGQICLDDIRHYDCDALVSLKSSRNQIQLVLPPGVSLGEQEQLIKRFNRELQDKRQEYHSLFMTNYRDKNRKRISFNFAYNLLNYLYFSYRNPAALPRFGG